MENMIIKDVENILNSTNVKIVERLLGGMSNYTYVVETDNSLYTFRVPGEFSENFVNRVFEKSNIKTIESLNITNETIYLNIEDGKKLAKYVAGTPLSMTTDYPYQKVADVLKVIHNSNLKAVNDYLPFTRLNQYQNLIIGLGFQHPQAYLELRKRFDKYQSYLESQTKVLTHGDSQPSNFVVNTDKLLVVDFEFCANNDLIYDISCFANKNFEDGLKLLYTYYHEPTFDQILRFHLWRCFQCLQWFNVAVFKDLKGMSQTLKIDFAMVSKRYLNLASELMEKIQNLK